MPLFRNLLHKSKSKTFYNNNNIQAAMCDAPLLIAVASVKMMGLTQNITSQLSVNSLNRVNNLKTSETD